MPSSTSSSSGGSSEAGERPTGPPAGPFFARACVLLLVILVTALGTGRVIGSAHHPRPLTVEAAEVAAADHFVLLLGNSRFAAGIDPERLARRLSRPGATVRTHMFEGGGWDALHYYMLAMLSGDALRRGRDAVVIEVSPGSIDDGHSANRLGVLRPETAAAIARLPGAPIETRLDVLCGAAAGLYRYRVSLQGMVIAPRLETLAQQLVGPLGRAGLIGEPRQAAPFQLVLAPGRDFVIDHVKGDRAALLAATRRTFETGLPRWRGGGYKLEALRRAVLLLEQRGVRVILVETPTSAWAEARLAESATGQRYFQLVRGLADGTGALLMRDWPAPLRADTLFWDDAHMVSTATADFTDALADRLYRGVFGGAASPSRESSNSGQSSSGQEGGGSQ